MPEAKAPNPSEAQTGISSKVQLSADLSADLAASPAPTLPRAGTLSLSGWMRSVMDDLSDDDLPRS